MVIQFFMGGPNEEIGAVEDILLDEELLARLEGLRGVRQFVNYQGRPVVVNCELISQGQYSVVLTFWDNLSDLGGFYYDQSRDLATEKSGRKGFFKVIPGVGIVPMDEAEVERAMDFLRNYQPRD